MNWKRVSLAKLSWQTALVGIITGVWGAGFYKLGLAVGGLAGAGALGPALGGAGLGAALCGGLAATEAIVHGFWHRLGRSLALALPTGALTGGLGFVLVQFALQSGAPGGLLHALAAPVVALPVVLGLLAGAGGAISGLRPAHPGGGLRRGAVGLLAGAALGVPLAQLSDLLGWAGPVFSAALAVWGAVVAWAMFWWEKKLARSWLRLLTGPDADTLFPLNGHRVTLGSLEENDIPLPGHQEVFPRHCHLARNGEQYEIVDDGEGGAVQVNYRPVNEYTLKNGDLVKLGTALLQYGEQR